MENASLLKVLRKIRKSYTSADADADATASATASIPGLSLLSDKISETDNNPEHNSVYGSYKTTSDPVIGKKPPTPRSILKLDKSRDSERDAAIEPTSLTSATASHWTSGHTWSDDMDVAGSDTRRSQGLDDGDEQTALTRNDNARYTRVTGKVVQHFAFHQKVYELQEKKFWSNTSCFYPD